MPAKKKAARKPAKKVVAKKKVAPKKPVAKKKVAPKKPVVKEKAAPKKAAPPKVVAAAPAPAPELDDAPALYVPPVSKPKPEPVNDTAVKPGDPAPYFEMTGDDDVVTRLTDFRGQNVVLYFYPRDNTPGCTIEAKDFSQLLHEFAAKNTVVIGVSTDDLKSHRRFRNTCDLTVKLLSDSDTKAHQAYGVWKEKNMYGRKMMGTRRSTFLIDEDGRVKKVWPKVSVEDHALDVLNSL